MISVIHEGTHFWNVSTVTITGVNFLYSLYAITPFLQFMIVPKNVLNLSLKNPIKTENPFKPHLKRLLENNLSIKN